MIKLPRLSQDIENEFYKDIASRYKALLESKQTKCAAFKKIYDYVFVNADPNINKIKDIVIGKKADLLQMINNLGVVDEKMVVDSFRDEYGKFINRKLGKELAEKMGVKTCPYCNRSYVFTLKDKGIRPQYDHFFPISKYPYLGVSLYNLIPSCGICNLAKKDEDTFDSVTRKNSFIYPYEDEYGHEIFFETKYTCDFSYWLGVSEDFDLGINTENVEANLKDRVNKANDKLRLLNLYKKHKDYILDIIKQCNIYQDSYAEDLVIAFPKLFKSIEEVQNILFMNYLQKEKWGDRVLAKLTHDIRKEFM